MWLYSSISVKEYDYFIKQAPPHRVGILCYLDHTKAQYYIIDCDRGPCLRGGYLKFMSTCKKGARLVSTRKIK